MKTFTEWPKWLQELLKAIAIALATFITTWFASCSTTHTVSHTFVNKSTGDTIVQQYQQTGRTILKKAEQ